MIAIVDYGVGNLFSLKCSLDAIGVEAVVTGDAAVLRNAEKIILPGVGAFGDAARKLRDSGLTDFIKGQAKEGKQLLGICLGMQLLLEKSYEYGEHEGLGLISGEIRPICDVIPKELKNSPKWKGTLHWNGSELAVTAKTSLFGKKQLFCNAPK